MKISRMLLISIVAVGLTYCVGAQRTVMLNHFPEYGNVKKDAWEKRVDMIFLADMKKSYSSMREASEELVSAGWYYYYQKDIEHAMFRFNQGWLCDSTYSWSYWGFAVVEATKGKFESSKHYFKKSHSFGNEHPSFFRDWSEMFLALRSQTDSVKYAIKADSVVNFGLAVDSLNGGLNIKKAWALYYLGEYKQAETSYEKAVNADSSLLDKELNKLIQFSLNND
ncbi:hypothetical protein EP331_14905 [bacterium]|nr:MAG: hypothetical protein EP331_14905 [bacterium]